MEQIHSVSVDDYKHAISFHTGWSLVKKSATDARFVFGSSGQCDTSLPSCSVKFAELISENGFHRSSPQEPILSEFHYLELQL